MKKLTLILLALLALAAVGLAQEEVVVEEAVAEEVVEEPAITIGATLDIYTAYVWRGQVLNGGLAVQPGIEVASGDAFFGVWASLHDDSELLNLDTESANYTAPGTGFGEIDLYAGYGGTIGESVYVGLGTTIYLVPSALTLFASPVGEAYISVGLDVITAPTLSLYVDSGGNAYVDLGLGYDIAVSDEFGVSFGTTPGLWLSTESGTSFGSVFVLPISLSAAYQIDSLSVGATVGFSFATAIDGSDDDLTALYFGLNLGL